MIHANLPPLIMTNRENLKRLICDGHAVALVPEIFTIHDIYCQQGLIKLVPVEGGVVGVVYLLYPSSKELTVLECVACGILWDILKNLDKTQIQK